MAAIEYRPALDGLRAVAVASVMVFHLERDWLPGGFVGVDVFFVLSGFLITSIILAECEAGAFSFARFYQRRISRIFPASFLVLAVVMAAAAWLYTAQDWASVGAVAAAAALSLANMKIMLQGNYFEASADAQPLLHFWSLAVEEQFYLVFPLLVYWCVRVGGRRLLVGVLVALGLASFAACVWMTGVRQSWAFYLLPTRAWELVAGCLLAACVKQGAPPPNGAAWRAGIGLAMVLASFALLQEGAGFPGYIAAVPVLGTVLCIGRFGAAPTPIERGLSHSWLVTIGKASYSLYLWHWPVYSMVDYAMYGAGWWTRLVLKLSLTLLLSFASYALYERPLRRFLNRPPQMRLGYATLAVGVAALVATGFFIRTHNFVNARPASVAQGGLRYDATAEDATVVLVGDSNGSMYAKTVREIARELRLNLNVLSVAAGDPLPDTELYRDTLSFLDQARPRVTLLITRWSHKVGDRPERLHTAVDELLQRSDRLILIEQPPTLPEYAKREIFRREGLRPIREEPEAAELRRKTNGLLRSLKSDRVAVVEVDDLFVTSEGVVPYTDDSGRPLWHDATHVSGYGADLVRPRIRSAIVAALQDAPVEDNRGNGSHAVAGRKLLAPLVKLGQIGRHLRRFVSN